MTKRDLPGEKVYIPHAQPREGGESSCCSAALYGIKDYEGWSVRCAHCEMPHPYGKGYRLGKKRTIDNQSSSEKRYKKGSLIYSFMFGLFIGMICSGVVFFILS